MNKKGISPLIAAVLLIAFTMAIASIFAKWAPQLIKSAQGDTKNKSAELERCSGVVIDISDANATHATIRQTQGEDPVGNMSVTWFYHNAGPVQAFAEITNNRGAVQTNGAAGNANNDFKEVKVNPIECEGAAADTWESGDTT